MHLNKQTGSSSQDRLPQLPPIIQICSNDLFSISIPWTALPTVFSALKVAPIPPAYKDIERGKWQKPNIHDLLFNTKKLEFWTREYHQIDLKRVCDLEEIVNEWYDLSADNQESRNQTLRVQGFVDLVEYPFKALVEAFSKKFSIDSLQIGGNYFRVIKMGVKAHS